MKQIGTIVCFVFVSLFVCARSQASDPIHIYGPTGQDDQPQIQGAIETACSLGNTDVVLHGGVYYLGAMWVPAYDRYTHLYFDLNCNNVALRGNDGEQVTLIFNTISNGILVNGSTDLRIENLVFDWYYHPFGQGTVSYVDNYQNIWVTNDAGYTTWDHAIFHYDNQGVYVTRTNRGNTPPNCILQNATNHGSGFANGKNYFHFDEPVTSRSKYGRITTGLCTAGIGPGDKVVLNRGSWQTNGIHMYYVKGAMLRNLTFYAAPGTAIMNEHSGRGNVYPQINMVGINVSYHPTDTSRTFTVNANAIYSTGSRAALYIAAASIGRCNTLVKDTCGCFKAQGFSWSLIKLPRHSIEFGLRQDR